MDEEDEMAVLDYRSPKGSLIKLLEQKIKKPEIDDSLGKVLDQFSQLNNDQSTYLEHGIFHMSFAEDALLLQSCAQFYAKRVDSLWDELLQLHTRMVTYDAKTAKYCTDSDKREARNKEIAKLEERLNRGKRKKIVLARPEEEADPLNGLALFDIEQGQINQLFDNVTFPFPEDEPVCEDNADTPFDFDFEAIDEWRAINDIDEEECRRSYYSTFVAHYYRLRFRFKHFATPNSNAIIYDWTDPEEYNTREIKLISCNPIRLMFFENNRCLLPDENFLIAKLRCAYILKRKWFINNQVDPTAPYETYKDSWEQYQQAFFADEKRKIQNMPQRTSAELLRFYKALARKEELAREQVENLKAMGVQNLPTVTFDNVIVAPTAEGYTGIFDSYTPEEFLDTPAQQPVERDVSTEATAPAVCEGDHEAEPSELLADSLDQNADAASDNPRSDSGYFDGPSGDNDSDHEANRGNVANGTETPFEFDNETNKNTEEAAVEDSAQNSGSCEESRESPETTISQMNAGIECSTMDTSKFTSTFSDSTENTECTFEIEPTNLSEEDNAQLEITSVDRTAMNSAIKEFTKQGSSEPDLLYQTLENSYFEQTDYMTSIVYDKPSDDVDVPCHGDFSIFLGYFDKENEIDAMEAAEAELKSRKRKLVVIDKDEPWPKRKRLSKQQVEKLKRSLIAPVKEQKWESFFSLNYQPECGEGDITRFAYESDSEEESEDEDISNYQDEVSTECETTHTDLKIHVSDYSIESGAKENNSDHCRSSPESPELSQDTGVEVNTSLNTSVENSPSQPLAEENPTSNQVTPASATISFEDLKNSMCPGESLPDVYEIEEEPRKLTPAEEEAEKSKARVEEWNTYITAKLKKLDEKDFNIHEYGTKMISNMDMNETKPFGDFVRGKSSAEVVRFFTASLQLANTLNVEICGAQKGKLSNDTFQLKLLSKERYHEQFQNYQAPSEENIPNKLEKIKEIRMQNKKSQSSKDKAPQPIAQQSRTRKNSSKTSGPSQPSKKIKILNYNILKVSGQDSVPIGTSTSKDLSDPQPSTSFQADLMDQQDVLDSAIFEMHGPSRISVDSGFMPSCDEEFLEQFEQLQRMNENCLQSSTNCLE